jgi:hypothetical protein
MREVHVKMDRYQRACQIWVILQVQWRRSIQRTGSSMGTRNPRN